MNELDEVFQLLSKERRRFVLYYLDEQCGPVPVSELAEKIQEWETDSTPEKFPDENYQNITLTLKHQHLPRAAKMEYVEYDADKSTIQLTGTPASVSVILSVAEFIEQPGKDDIHHLV